jgi:hypothetical protein
LLTRRLGVPCLLSLFGEPAFDAIFLGEPIFEPTFDVLRGVPALEIRLGEPGLERRLGRPDTLFKGVTDE